MTVGDLKKALENVDDNLHVGDNMTVGDLKKALENVDDNLHVMVKAKTFEGNVIGPMDSCSVNQASQGFDWEFLYIYDLA